MLFYRGGIARPELQFKVYGSDGRLIGISDCYWPECRHLGEFDGKVKYGRLLRPGEEPGDAVFPELRRSLDPEQRISWVQCLFPTFTWETNTTNSAPGAGTRTRRRGG